MKKIKLTLKPSELTSLIGFLEFQFTKLEFTKHEVSKLVQACLVELYNRLKGVFDLFKRDDYNLTINVSWGLALLELCKAKDCFIPSMDVLAVNKVIGIIDQKTI